MKVVLICLLLATMPTYHVEADGPADYQYDREQLKAYLIPLTNIIKMAVPALKKFAHEFVAHICQLCKQRGGK
jgi:hypothetical protein